MGRPGANGPHDLGGVDLDLPLDRSDKDYALWERTTHALMLALVRKGLLTVDELRRGIEGLSEEAQKLTYYEKWAASLAAICVERGVVTEDELQAQLGTKEEQPQEPRFHAGDLVRVREENSAVRWRKPHLRTPGYIFGLVGRVERDCQGLFGNPEDLAFRHDAPKQPMYRVRFAQVDVWEGYVGGDNDSVDVEIYQPWLLPATQEELAAQHAARASRRAVFLGHAAAAATHAPAHGDAPDHHHDGEDHQADHAHGESHKRQRVDPGTHGHDHAHAHGHSHAHDHGDGHDHVHEERCAVEQAAVNKESEEDGERRRLAEALARAVVAKGVVTPAELREGVELMDTRGHSGAGARIVARAWLDPEFKKRLLKDAGAAVAELGISASVYPTPPAAPATVPASAEAAAPAAAPAPPVLPVRHGTILTVVENTDTVHNLIVCTLCSCYPLSILGMSPNWYKSRAYRARAVRDPRGVLREFGTELPEGVTVAVHDSTADNRYLVLPLRPSGTEGWSEEQLQALVTRDAMIGVAVCKVPAA